MLSIENGLARPEHAEARSPLGSCGGCPPDTGASFFPGWLLLWQSTVLAIVVAVLSHFEIEQSLFLGEETQEQLRTSRVSISHLRRCACLSPLALGSRDQPSRTPAVPSTLLLGRDVYRYSWLFFDDCAASLEPWYVFCSLCRGDWKTRPNQGIYPHLPKGGSLCHEDAQPPSRSASRRRNARRS